MKPKTTMDCWKFKIFRQKLGLTQAQLADILGVHPVTVWEWEKGRSNVPQSPGMVLAMLEAEQVTVDELADIWERALVPHEAF